MPESIGSQNLQIDNRTGSEIPKSEDRGFDLNY
jgi:hypothetical protein